MDLRERLARWGMFLFGGVFRAAPRPAAPPPAPERWAILHEYEVEGEPLVYRWEAEDGSQGASQFTSAQAAFEDARLAGFHVRLARPFPIDGRLNLNKYLRPAVARLAEQMEERMRQNDAKRGPASWLDSGVSYGAQFENIQRHLAQVDEALANMHKGDPDALGWVEANAADAANHLAIIVDLARANAAEQTGGMENG